MTEATIVKLPGLDCGVCGYRTCNEFETHLKDHPDQIKRCIYLSKDCATVPDDHVDLSLPVITPCQINLDELPVYRSSAPEYQDNLGREFDFYLERFLEDSGPREVILPRNPMLARELDIQPGDVLIGRPLGISCGCPVSHCGIVQQVDQRTGVITWCIAGPLIPRQSEHKDLGYYSAEAYEGLIRETRCEIKIGMRYFFQPRTCMLQWRHSGLVNYINKTDRGLQVRLEGIWIG